MTEEPRAASVDRHVRAALAHGEAMLHRRLAEVSADIASHEAEVARLGSERDFLASKLALTKGEADA